MLKLTQLLFLRTAEMETKNIPYWKVKSYLISSLFPCTVTVDVVFIAEHNFNCTRHIWILNCMFYNSNGEFKSFVYINDLLL
jgi:hypothetical protein